jgi:hypothetical protein
MAVPDLAQERQSIVASLEELRDREAWCRAVVAAAAPDEDVAVIADDAERYRRVIRHLERLLGRAA